MAIRPIIVHFTAQRGTRCMIRWRVDLRWQKRCAIAVGALGTAVKHANLQKPAITTPTFFVFKICISQNSMGCEMFGRFRRRICKIITDKAMKR